MGVYNRSRRESEVTELASLGSSEICLKRGGIQENKEEDFTF